MLLTRSGNEVEIFLEVMFQISRVKAVMVHWRYQLGRVLIYPNPNATCPIAIPPPSRTDSNLFLFFYFLLLHFTSHFTSLWRSIYVVCVYISY